MAKQAAGRTRNCVRTEMAFASKKAILNVEFFRSECRALFGPSGGTRLGAIFRNADFSLCEGEIGRAAVYHAHSGTVCATPAGAGRETCAAHRADGDR